MYVENLVEEVVTSAEQAQRYLDIGAKNRHVGTTLMNERSSRSHSVFMLAIDATETRNQVPTHAHACKHYTHMHWCIPNPLRIQARARCSNENAVIKTNHDEKGVKWVVSFS